MPKVSKLQASFNAGQISKSVFGRVDNPRYEQGLLLCQNYIPIVQGPIIRRPGTKFAEYTKFQTLPLPVIIPFQFSISQNYILEFGDYYIRFYTNEGQIITAVTQYAITGLFNLSLANTVNGQFSFWANRISPSGLPGETTATIVSSSITAGSILELFSPYAAQDVAKIKWIQKQDTLFLTHPSYAPYKLQRLSGTEWQLKPVGFTDGPYLPLNSYQTIGDSTQIQLSAIVTGTGPSFHTAPSFTCSNMATNGAGLIRVTTTTPHNFSTGTKVVIENAHGTIEANNIGTNGCPVGFGSSTIVACSFWTVTYVGATQFDLQKSTFTNAYTGSATVYPALFMMDSTGSWADWNRSKNSIRSIGIVGSNSIRYSFHIQTVNAAHWVNLIEDQNQSQSPWTDASSIVWQMGCYNLINQFPSCVALHQDRLTFAGHANIPQQFDASMTSNYEVFSASGSNQQVNNNNALQFSLSSQDLNSIKWMKSTTQGLLAGTANSEWAISANTQTPALTPTNISAVQVTYYGSYDTDALPVNNSVLYIQRAGRKTRELLYYWQVGSFRSTNLSELAESLTLPQVTKLVNVKEPHPQVWAVRSDGALLSAAYNRDDVNFALTVGWAQHQLGGRSNATGAAPIVTSIASIPSSDATYDEMWMVVQRYMNGSTLGTIEYMTKPYDDNSLIQDAYHFDCGITYYNSTAISNITAGSGLIAQFTMANSSFANGTMVRIQGVTGPAYLNNQSWIVASTLPIFNTLLLLDPATNAIAPLGSSAYGGGGSMAPMVTTISGLSWLAGEQVGIIADGMIQPNSSVTAAGVLNLGMPAAKVQIGYPYPSSGQLLRSKDGSAQGTSIASTRRCNRVAFMLHNVGDFSFGPNFMNLLPAEFYTPDQMNADNPVPLFDGIHRDGIESPYGFDDTICFQQSSGLPGMVQAVVRFFEEFDV